MFNKILILILLTITLNAQAEFEFENRHATSTEKTSLGVTHILPSVYVLPDRQIVLGTTVGIGLFDVVDFTSNLFLDLQQVFNISSKISVWGNDNHAVALTASFVQQTVKFQSRFNNSYTSENATMFSPGAVYSYRIWPTFTGHFGGNFVFRNPAVPKSSLFERTAYVQGTTLHKEFTKGISKTLAVSSGLSYDVTYDIWGVGASAHIGGFQLGAHYYLNVSEGSFMPIIAGGFTTSL